MTLDQPDDTLGRAAAAGLLGAEARVVEVPGKRAGAPAETATCVGWQQRSEDAMPKARLGRLGAVVQEAREHEIVVASARAEQGGGPLGVAPVGIRGSREADQLPHPHHR